MSGVEPKILLLEIFLQNAIVPRIRNIWMLLFIMIMSLTNSNNFLVSSSLLHNRPRVNKLYKGQSKQLGFCEHNISVEQLNIVVCKSSCGQPVNNSTLLIYKNKPQARFSVKATVCQYIAEV